MTSSPDAASIADDSCFPRVGLWELSVWYKLLKSTVLRLERAYEAGDLDATLAHPEIENTVGVRVVDSYRRLSRRGRRPDNRFRRAGVHKVLEPARRLLQPCARILEAAAERRSHGLTGLLVPVPGQPTPVRLRVDQAVSAREWGIGFRLEHPGDEDVLASAVVRHVVLRLQSDLGALAGLQGRYKHYAGGEALLVPDEAGHAFEQLMLDVLNETAACARRAPLHEDVLEHTDLRYKTPAIRRRRGARIQVTRTFERTYHAAKLERMRRPEEYVILSPRALADALRDRPALLDADQHEAFWLALPGRPADTDGVAAALRSLFDQAIAQAAQHPQGAVAGLPVPVRALIRRYVHEDAIRSVAALRAREKLTGPRRRWS